MFKSLRMLDLLSKQTRVFLNIDEKLYRKQGTNCNVNINITAGIDYKYKPGLLRLHSCNCNDSREGKTALSPK